MALYFHRSHLLLAALLLLCAAPLSAQDIGGDLQLPSSGLGDLLSGQAGGSGGGLEKPVTFESYYQLAEDGRTGRMVVKAKLAAGLHTYSTTQEIAVPGPQRTELIVTTDPPAAIISQDDFAPDKAPKIKPADDIFPVDSEEFYGEVEWSATFILKEGVAPKDLKINIQLKGQFCGEGTCNPFPISSIEATYKSEVYKPANGYFTPNKSKLTWLVTATPKVVEPGGVVTVTFLTKPGDVMSDQSALPEEMRHHIYERQVADSEEFTNKPTLLVFTRTFGVPAVPMKTKGRRITKQGSPLGYYDAPVSWTYEIQVPSGVKEGKHRLVALMGFQTCTENTCAPPEGAEITTEITVRKKPATATADSADEDNTAYFVFSPVAYDHVAAQADNQHWTFAKVANIFLLAFVGGFLLNFMPCVLPVIPLKAMSFMQQAGQKRAQLLALNLWYTLGIVVVFWAFAAVAISLRLFYGETLSWGSQFSNPVFNVAMVSVIFVFGLSLLGVWEIRLPGFVGGGKANQLAEKEGPAGSFFKGVLATMLATPCTGPAFGAAMTFAVGAPPIVAIIAFTLMGLGMAVPYLLIACFPALISWIPKPGPWMITFKQLTGFVLLGTVIWFFSFVPDNLIVPLLALLLSLGLTLWWIGSTSITASAQRKATGWISGIALNAVVIAFAFFGAYNYLMPSYELEWQEFSRASVKQHVAEKKTVLVDFTADWCNTCKVNEALVLNTKAVKTAVEENGVVAIKADKTNDEDAVEVDNFLLDLGNYDKGIPFVAIFPANGSKPIVIKGPLTQSGLLAALTKAGASEKSSDTETEAPTDPPAAETAMNSP